MQDARTLVLIHAFPLGARMWEPQLHAFSGWRVVTPSLPGFDGDQTHETTMDGFARHVNAALDRLGVDRAVIAGLSLGGYVTFGLMRQRPERATALILADTRCGADSDEGRAGRMRMLEILEREGPDGVFNDMRPKLLGATTLAERPDVVDRVKGLVRSQAKPAIAGAIRAMLDRPDSTPLLADVRVPTLVVVGDEDLMTPPAESERIQCETKGAALVQISRAGHLSNLENPDAFNAAVRRFLSTLA